MWSITQGILSKVTCYFLLTKNLTDFTLKYYMKFPIGFAAVFHSIYYKEYIVYIVRKFINNQFTGFNHCIFAVVYSKYYNHLLRCECQMGVMLSGAKLAATIFRFCRWTIWLLRCYMWVAMWFAWVFCCEIVAYWSK